MLAALRDAGGMTPLTDTGRRDAPAAHPGAVRAAEALRRHCLREHSPPTSGVLGTPRRSRRAHAPLVHVGGPEHQQSASSAPRPEAQLSEEVGDDHP